MTWRENIERVRKALPTRADEHHNLCNTRHKKPCDCYARQTAPAHAALDALTAQIEELEASAFVRDAWRTRAEAAEQRVEELEAALRRIRENATSWHGPLCETGHEKALAVIALWCDAALAQSDSPASG